MIHRRHLLVSFTPALSPRRRAGRAHGRPRASMRRPSRRCSRAAQAQEAALARPIRRSWTFVVRPTPMRPSCAAIRRAAIPTTRSGRPRPDGTRAQQVWHRHRSGQGRQAARVAAAGVSREQARQRGRHETRRAPAGRSGDAGPAAPPSAATPAAPAPAPAGAPPAIDARAHPHRRRCRRRRRCPRRRHPRLKLALPCRSVRSPRPRCRAATASPSSSAGRSRF